MAGFIFGDNVSAKTSKSEKVAMTSPVIAEQQKANKSNSEKVAMTSPVAAKIEGNRQGSRRSIVISCVHGLLCAWLATVCIVNVV